MGPCLDGGLHTLFSVFLAAALFGCVAAGSCEVKRCSKEYSDSLKQARIQHSRTYVYCTILRSYISCVRATARSCRGDLEYHSILSLVMQWDTGFNCTNIIAQGPQQDYSGHGGNQRVYRPHKHRPAGVAECSAFRSASGSTTVFSHCGLFGDPHLRTFYNELQTCRVMGAWPLIDNPYLAVQVTNDAVMKGSSATATSKVTVIVREHGHCASEKTYEAQTDFLPSVFVDGSKSGGPGVRIKEENPGRHIEIHLRYIATRIVIRQVGRYLTFAVRMPREIAIQGAQTDTTELCVRGCPKRERIDFNQLLSQPDQFISMVTSRGHVAIPKKEALATCRQYNVTDFYFDACVFDLLTTGDSTFSMAAREAMRDVLTLYPSAAFKHQNRTSIPPSVTHVQEAASTTNCATNRSFGVLLIIMLLLCCRLKTIM